MLFRSLTKEAELIILGYPLYGIDPDISDSERETSLDDAYIIIEMLEKEPELINLDEDTQFELKATVESMIEELENGE